MAVVLSTLGVATVAIALRFYTRVAIVRNFWPEDWTLAASWLFSVGLAAASVVQVKHGAGRHIIVLPYPIIVQQLKALYATLILYGFAINLVKISILLQIRRVFPQKFIRRSSLVLMIITFIVAIVGLSLQIFECNPIPKAYNPMLPGKCIPHIISWFTGASLNMLLDIAIFLLPLPPLRKLKIPRRQKVTLYLVFCLGFSVCIVSVVRLPSLHKLSISRDPTYDNATTLYLTFIEVNVAIICASIPPLKALVKRYMPLLLGVISDAKSS
ncbi:Hypothetical protein D9617_16g015350 [Elsinoe fawcettii]|nr:Hypothetical protein D9617_16g015350 [Elsinoe fawcettii]